TGVQTCALPISLRRPPTDGGHAPDRSWIGPPAEPAVQRSTSRLAGAPPSLLLFRPARCNLGMLSPVVPPGRSLSRAVVPVDQCVHTPERPPILEPYPVMKQFFHDL